MDRDKRDMELMNEDQKAVVRRLAQTKDYLIVHGMPGTGKTTTIALLVCFSTPPPPQTQATKSNERDTRMMVIDRFKLL